MNNLAAFKETAQRARLSEGSDMTKTTPFGYIEKALSILVHSVDGAAHAVWPCPPAEPQTCLVRAKTYEITV